MKLASKIFLGSALVMVVLVGVGILSLRAVGPVADQVGESREDPVAATRGGAEDARAGAAVREQRTGTGVLVALGCPLGLGLGGAAVLANRLTRRLRVLSEATAAVAAGSFREPIPERGADEIAALAHSFNAMAANLRQLDQLKESFLATVSHELRSPLTSMREAAHLLHEEVAGPRTPPQTPPPTTPRARTQRPPRLCHQ